MTDLSFRHEARRKLIHIACSILPVCYYYFLNREQIVLISGSITLVFLLAELIRKKTKFGAVLFQKVFTPLLREEEKHNKLTGATHLFLSATVTFLVFEKIIAITAVLLLTIADSLAAISGKMSGKRNLFNKSWQGTITFFLISVLLIFIFLPEAGIWIPVIAAIVSVIEVLPLPVNDNLLITVASGILLTVAI